MQQRCGATRKPVRATPGWQAKCVECPHFSTWGRRLGGTYRHPEGQPAGMVEESGIEDLILHSSPLTYSQHHLVSQDSCLTPQILDLLLSLVLIRQGFRLSVLAASLVGECIVEPVKEQAQCAWQEFSLLIHNLWSLHTRNGCSALSNQCCHSLRASLTARSSLNSLTLNSKWSHEERNSQQSHQTVQEIPAALVGMGGHGPGGGHCYVTPDSLAHLRLRLTTLQLLAWDHPAGIDMVGSYCHGLASSRKPRCRTEPQALVEAKSKYFNLQNTYLNKNQTSQEAKRANPEGSSIVP